MLAACVASGTDFQEFARSIEVTEEELRQFDFLIANQIVPEWKVKELCEWRKKIRLYFEELAESQEKICQTPKPAN